MEDAIALYEALVAEAEVSTALDRFERGRREEVERIQHAARRLTPHWELSPAAAEDTISIANCHRLLRAYHQAEVCPA
ncbi:hypothetical protein MTDSW087_04297 [Methylobacterium dankookense]|uniref:Uncharacterized protein n=1 Tax=Methylobacterium dankookense TaxID=560405 RepID=A0A564G385_9HYPH|nr:hypothetical protein MTDSW087_04297 [Methylobacterium dankookense]